MNAANTASDPQLVRAPLGPWLLDRDLHPVLFDLDRSRLVFARANTSAVVSDPALHRDGMRVPLRHMHFTAHYAASIDDVLAHTTTGKRARRPVHFVFMTDFCGSTLLVNSLANLPSFDTCFDELELFKRLSLARRLFDAGQVADEHGWHALVEAGVATMARHASERARIVIKEQPVTNYIANELLSIVGAWRSIFVYSPLEDYLLAVLKSDNRRAYTRARVELYIETGVIPALAGIDKQSLSDARIAALHWLTQMLTYADVPQPVRAHKLRALNGLSLLQYPARTLHAVCSYLGVGVSEADIDSVVESAVFGQHAKRTHRRYSWSQRVEEVDAWRAAYRDELRDGMRWAERIVERTSLARSPEPRLD